MSRAKPSKIDLYETYPCPCRRREQLTPIALTEALGCSRCHHVFVIRPDGYTLEQLSSAHPYKQMWYWTGKEWSPVHSPLNRQGCFWLLGVVCCLLIPLLFCLPIAFNIPLADNLVVWILAAVGLFLAVSIVTAWFWTARNH